MREDLRKLFAVAVVTASGVAFAGTDYSASASSASAPSLSSESSTTSDSSARTEPALSDPSGTTPNESMEDRSLSASGTNPEHEPLARGDQGTQAPGILPGERSGMPSEAPASAASGGEPSAQAGVDCQLNPYDAGCQS